MGHGASRIKFFLDAVTRLLPSHVPLLVDAPFYSLPFTVHLYFYFPLQIAAAVEEVILHALAGSVATPGLKDEMRQKYRAGGFEDMAIEIDIPPSRGGSGGGDMNGITMQVGALVSLWLVISFLVKATWGGGRGAGWAGPSTSQIQLLHT